MGYIGSYLTCAIPSGEGTLPKSYPADPLAYAIRGKAEDLHLPEVRDISRAIYYSTGIDARLSRLILTQPGHKVTERTVDLICCNFLCVHPSFVYGEWYFGDRIEKYMVELDQLYGTSISTYCDHQYEVVSPTDFPHVIPPTVEQLLLSQHISLVQCGLCSNFSHTQNALGVAG